MNTLANSLLSLGVAFLLAILAYSVPRWVDGALLRTEVLLYVAVPAVGIGLLLISLRLDRDKKAIAALCLLAVGVAVYAAEGYLSLTERRNEVELDFVQQLRRQGDNAYPFILPRALLEPGPDGGLRSVLTIDGIELLPLAQVSNSLSVACNELGENMVYQTDRHGFRNPEDGWVAATVDIAAIGDSFVEGDCVGPDDNMIAWVKRSHPNTLNLGVGGTGPLEHLAILKEYARPFRPKIVIWVFYEGNDLIDLERAKAEPSLMKYLGADFTQSLLERQPEIDRKLADYTLSRMEKVVSERRSRRLIEFVKLRRLRSKLLGGWPRQRHYDFSLFEAILTAAKDVVDSWGGELYFVYLPTASRFFGHAEHKEELLAMQLSVRRIVTALDISFVDVPAAFEAEREPKALWFHQNSHYNETGYRIAAQAVLNALAASPS